MAHSLDDFELEVYDFEVFAHDWLVVFRDRDGRETWYWHEQAAGMLEHVGERPDALFCSFNGSHYDRWIMAAIAAGCSPEEVKEVNDAIIGAGPDAPPIWEHPYLEGSYFKFNDVDLMKDTQAGTSLKSVEAHLGMSVEESGVDFRIGRPLEPAERDEVLAYCRHDVEATARLLDERRGYLETKLALAERAGLDPARALAMTNAKLTAAVLGAERREYGDEREYAYPANMAVEALPGEVVEFFDRVGAKGAGGEYLVPDEELWAGKLEIEVVGCPVTLGFGGIHGALPRYREEARDGRRIVNVDVSSYYPSLMVRNGYCSRSMATPATFEAIYRERLEAKAAGDKATADALKLVVNTTYGATLNQYNPLYDPLMARSVCISGQLYLLELACTLARHVPTLRLVQLNTDGIMVSVDEAHLPMARAIWAEWEGRTGFELEEDDIALVWQRDVNNYAMRMVDGHEKLKGGRLVRGISRAGAFSANNDAPVVADALRRYLLDGTPVAETVMACDDPMAFQLVAKAGSKFSRVYQETAGGQVEMQRCNRVFATADESLGTLYKVKRETGQVAKMAGLPEHCLVRNAEPPGMGEIDRGWYAALAERWAAEFGPEEGPGGRDMASTKQQASASVHARLARARRLFYERAGAKSGVNPDQGWTYVELIDMAPLQARIFEEVGLLEEFSWSEGEPTLAGTEHDPEGGTSTHYEKGEPVARSVVRSVDDPEQCIVFELPWREVEPIVSKATGKAVDNSLQREGKAVTYLRRYLKMMVLDVALPDEVDGAAQAPREPAGPVPGPTAPAKPGKPATARERAQAAAEIAAPEGAASQLQVRQLKKAAKSLKEAHPDSPEAAALIAEVGVATEGGAGELTKAEVEAHIRALGELKEKLDAGGADA